MRAMFGGATRNLTGRIRTRNSVTQNSTEIVIRPLCGEDAVALAALESRCAGAARWGEAAYHDAGKNGITGFAAESERSLVGFVLTRTVSDEMEILNVAVDPEARRRGIGKRLVARAIQEGRRMDVKRVYLEVRESNAAARAFYSSAGFAVKGRRKNYYSQPAEDALVLVLQLH